VSVAAAKTSTTLKSSASSTIYGQSVTLTATVTNSQTTASPTGTVTFKDGTTVVGTATVSNGVATLVLSSLTAGRHPLTAVFSDPNGNFVSSTSSSVFVTVTAAKTSATLQSSASSTIYGQPVTLTATVTNSQTTALPTCKVTFKDGGTVVGIATVSNGVATLVLSSLKAGNHTFTAVFTDCAGNFVTSTSAAISVAVAKAQTSTTLSATPNPAKVGQTVTFRATVSNTQTGAVPTGSVTFKDGRTTLGTATVTNGVATLMVSTLKAGSHSVTAAFTDSLGNFLGSTSAVWTEVVS
jgi:hypothetical protein